MILKKRCCTIPYNTLYYSRIRNPQDEKAVNVGRVGKNGSIVLTILPTV